MENNLLKYNEFIKKDFNIDRDSIPIEVQKKWFNELVEERSSKFRSLERRINLDNLIYKYKTEGRSLKDFRNYQNPIELFKHLRGGNVNPKKVLKIRNNFKSDLNLNLKSKDQISVIQIVEIFCDLWQKIIDFFFRLFYFAIWS